MIFSDVEVWLIAIVSGKVHSWFLAELRIIKVWVLTQKTIVEEIIKSPLHPNTQYIFPWYNWHGEISKMRCICLYWCRIFIHIFTIARNYKNYISSLLNIVPSSTDIYVKKFLKEHLTYSYQIPKWNITPHVQRKQPSSVKTHFYFAVSDYIH